MGAAQPGRQADPGSAMLHEATGHCRLRVEWALPPRRRRKPAMSCRCEVAAFG